MAKALLPAPTVVVGPVPRPVSMGALTARVLDGVSAMVPIADPDGNGREEAHQGETVVIPARQREPAVARADFDRVRAATAPGDG